MALSAGTRIGPYEVVSSLGVGGMGEVYRARDTKLGRDVAIKALPDLFAADREHIARFEREAQLLASLNHPHIGAIHGLQEVDGFQFLILEFIDGQTLADRIASGPLPVGDAIAIARQIADALSVAHDKGIIHRDLKPANIMLTSDGDVKVLDFGLARAAGAEMSSSAVNSPTLTFTATQMGVILGTAAYMSPEQANGRIADKRSDVWAFGVVLFEMLTGRRVFDGGDISETLAAVLRDQPRWADLPASLAPAIRDLLHGCLEKDRKARIRDISVVGYILDQGATDREGQSARTSVARIPAWRYVAVIAGTAAITAASAYVVWPRQPDAPEPLMTRYAITLSPGTVFSSAGRNVVAVSPDGNSIVFVANSELNLRARDDIDGHPIPGTRGIGDLIVNAPRNPFFSPDGRSIGFWQSGEIKSVSVDGGLSRKICAVDIPYGASWIDNMIVFGAATEGIFRVSATGGKPESLVKVPPGESAHGPQILPGGRTVLFTRAKGSDWENADIVLYSLDNGSTRVLIEGGKDARYLSTGHLVFARGRTLFATAFDPVAGTTSGAEVPVLDGIASAQDAITGASQFAVSADGTLVYAPRAGVVDAEPRQLAWVDRKGNEEILSAPPRLYASPRVSPDGRRIAAAISDGGDLEIVTWDKDRGLTQLTFDRATDHLPVWTHDGSRLVFASRRNGPLNLFVQPADGTSQAVRLLDTTKDIRPSEASIDGKYLVFEQRGPRFDLMLLTLEPRAEPQPLVSDPLYNERYGALSPDGRWLAYESDRRGQPEIYVKPFPDVNAADGWQVSIAGGRDPRWSRERNRLELFYVVRSNTSTGSTVMSRVNSGVTWAPSPPTKVLEGDYLFTTEALGSSYDVAPDGRFLVVKPAPRNAPAIPQRLIVVQNWFQELERLVPRR